MRIGVDLRLFAEGRQSGVEEYTQNILDGMLRLDSENEYVLFFNAYKSDVGLERVRKFEKYPNVTLKILKLPNKILNSSFVGLRSPKIDRLMGGLDVFFSPNIIFTALSRKVRHVLTIHDLSFEIYPEFLSRKRRIWHAAVNPKRMVGRSSQVIAVSHATKADVVRKYRIDEGRVSVVHSGLKKAEQAEDPHVGKFGITKPYLLFFATLEPRKNPQTVLTAFEEVRRRGRKDLQLVFAGASGWLEAQVRKAHAESPFLEDIIFTGSVSNEERNALYQKALALLYPSLYEGFGFPPLEAMQLGTPVITSSVSSLPEVVQDAAITIDPFDEHALTLAIEQLIVSPGLQERYKFAGSEHAKNFSWSEAAGETLNIITQNA